MTKKEFLGTALTLGGLAAGGTGAMQLIEERGWLVGAALCTLGVVLLVAGYRLLLIRTDAAVGAGLAPDGEGKA